MSSQVSEQPASKVETDPVIRRLREFVSAGIALVVIVASAVMFVQAFNFLSSPEEFDRVKDLLLFINPLLGVVVGYYFNRATSEARAEKAETTASTAMDAAQQATEARNQAESKAKAAEDEAEEVKSALGEVSDAAEKMMAQAPPAVGVLGVEEEAGEPVEDARIELQMALKRARRFRYGQ